MPSIFDWSATPSANVTVDGINIAENCPAANINNAARSIMALTRQTFSTGLQNFLAGTSPLAVASGGTGLSSALTTNALVKQGATNFAQSIISDDGSTATVAGALAANTLAVGTSLAGGTVATFGGALGLVTASGATVSITPDPSSGANGVNIAASFALGGYGPLRFSTSATERMRIDSSGNVGIGTTSPGALLQLNKASGASDIRFSTAGVLYGTIYASASDVAVNSVTAIPLILGTNNTERLRVDANGNVGIGTASPSRKLVVQDNFAYIGLNTTSTTNKRTGIAFSQNGTDQYEMGIDLGNSNSRNLYIYDAVATTTRILVDANGNVGVGTNSPTALLDVNGSTRLRGPVTLDSALSVAQGGTGSTTAAGARSALSAAVSGSNNDITALTALATAITVAQGGTGATTAAGARTNLGAQAAMTVTTNANGTAFGFTISGTTYYIQCMPVGALGVNRSTFLTYPVALSTAVLAAMADKYVSGPINDGLNLGSGAPGLSSMTVTNGGTAMSGGYAIVIGY